MKTKTLMLWLLVTVAVVAGIHFFGDKPGTAEREELARRVVTLPVDEVESVEIAGEQGAFTFQREGRGWQILSPVKYPANSGAVENLLSQLSFVERKRTLTVAEVGDLAQVGLQPPLTVVKLKTKAGAAVELDLGNETAVKGSVYARVVEGRESYAVIEGSVAALARRSLDQWRSDQVFHLTVDRVDGVVLHEEGKDIELKREGDAWRMVKPLSAAADGEVTRALLAEVLKLKAARFVTDNPAEYSKYNLNAPFLVLDLSAGAETVSLRVGRVEENGEVKYYAQQTAYPAVFALSPLMVGRLGGLLEQVRDRRIVRLGEVTGVELQRGNQNISLSAGDEGWMMTAPLSHTASRAELELLLTKLANARATAFHAATDENRAALGLNRPAARITLRLRVGDQEQSYTLTFSAAKKGVMAVESSFRDDIVSVPADVLVGLPAQPAGWLAPKEP